jgi:dynein heavy chain 2
MKAWRTHWDYQLYKVLEFQYQKGLENLNENLAEINVELVFKQQKLQFRPPFEIIRGNYYSAMRNFINFPLNFAGVGDTDIFKVKIFYIAFCVLTNLILQFLPDRNAASLGIVYKKAEELFRKLAAEKDQFYDWVILGTIDLDEYVDEVLLYTLSKFVLELTF